MLLQDHQGKIINPSVLHFEKMDSMQRAKLTVLIPTYNEEENIRDCLESVKWADEILIVDSYSNDRTLEIARQYTDRIIQHEYINSATQKNWAIPQSKYEWVLIVDSDERVNEDLKNEIEKALLQKPNDINGYYIPRKNFFLGKEIKHCGWEFEHDLNLRLFRRNSGRYEDKEVHADIIINGKTGRIKSPFLHYSYRSIDQYLKKLERYTNWGALDVARGDKKVGWHQFILRPVGTFVKMFILKRGFLDGIHGLILSLFSSYYVYIKYVKAWEIQRSKN